MAKPVMPVRMPRLSKPPLIAIVDDDEAVRDALCDLLLAEGLAAHAFAGAAAFLAEAAVADYGCIVTDVRMPEIDGVEFQHRLRAQGSQVPVIFITSTVDTAAQVQAVREGAIAWFTKPVADDALLAALRAALGGGGK